MLYYLNILLLGQKLMEKGLRLKKSLKKITYIKNDRIKESIVPSC